MPVAEPKETKEPGKAKKEAPTPPVDNTGVMHLYSIYPTYTLITKQEEASYEPGPSGRRVKVIHAEGQQLQFVNHRAKEDRKFMETLLANQSPRTGKKQFWYAQEWITAEDLAELYKNDSDAFDDFVRRMFIKQEQLRHSEAGITQAKMSRRVQDELKKLGLI